MILSNISDLSFYPNRDHGGEQVLLYSSMSHEFVRALEAFQTIRAPDPHGLALMEGPTNCNRACSYCGVPNRWNAKTASTVAETCQQINWGYKIFMILGRS